MYFSTMIVQRKIASEIQRLARKFSIVSITGPRQSGKTTLVKELFTELDYVNLELPENREFALNDPKGFLLQYKSGVIIDEVQNVPDLFSYIQVMTDEKTLKKVILTGSQNFLLMEKISQSLAGRVAIFHLLPFSMGELSATKYKSGKFEDYVFKGFYPGIYDRQLSPSDFYPSYIQTYIERDVRQLAKLKDLRQFQSFIKVCAGHVGQLVNYTTIGNNLGISDKTIKEWLSILETSFIVFHLPPFYKNFNKRIIKSPKLYFHDTGLACSLLGIKNTDELSTHYAKGALFENLIISELMKSQYNRGQSPSLYFWRSKSGQEIDLVIPLNQHEAIVEIKSGKTIHTDFFKNLNYYDKLAGNPDTKKFLIYGGDQSQNRTTAKILSWNNLQDLIDTI